MAPLTTIVYTFIHYDIRTHMLRSSVSFIVHFLHSSQLLPNWRHTNEQLLTPHCHCNTMGRSRAKKEEMMNVDRKKRDNPVFKVELAAEIAE